jgi:hypothetical protein
VTVEHPSLPRRAGKALSLCRANIAEFNERPPVPYVRRPGHRAEYRIVVYGVARADFEPQKLAKLAVRLTRNRDVATH